METAPIPEWLALTVSVADYGSWFRTILSSDKKMSGNVTIQNIYSIVYNFDNFEELLMFASRNR